MALAVFDVLSDEVSTTDDLAGWILADCGLSGWVVWSRWDGGFLVGHALMDDGVTYWFAIDFERRELDEWVSIGYKYDKPDQEVE